MRIASKPRYLWRGFEMPFLAGFGIRGRRRAKTAQKGALRVFSGWLPEK